jgi:hypothetical protein
LNSNVGTIITFDEAEWRETCKQLSDIAMHGCGLSYEFYAESFSELVDARVTVYSDDDLLRAIEIANEWDYMTVEEREGQQEWNAKNGCCVQGITLGCCPAGCGS